MSPELETLDQLIGGPMRTNTLRSIYDNPEHFERAIMAMLRAGELKLLENGDEVPSHNWLKSLRDSRNESEAKNLVLEITKAGIQRIG